LKGADGIELCNEPTPEADRYGVGSASRLKLREQVPDVGLDRLLREEETLADLPVDESVRHELKNLDLPRCRLLADLASRGRREGDHRAVPARTAARSCRLEAAAVVAIPVQDLLALSGIHAPGIGVERVPL
jgi:hypothetical protein